MSDHVKHYAMGWVPDYPDFRDYSVETNQVALSLQQVGQTASIKEMLSEVGVLEPSKLSIPDHQDLREMFSEIEDQEALGSCTAQAGAGLVEYFERRASGRHIDASRLFLYKVTRNLLGWSGDRGAYLRTTMGAMRLFGIPPEEYWPYDIQEFDQEPPAFCYAFAQNFRTIQYYRLDLPLTTTKALLNRIKVYLAAGLPSMFGFTVYSSIDQAMETGKIPFPSTGERVRGGHAVVAVGFDDRMKINNEYPGSKATKGALLIRNSWGKGWGEKGYGWLPYEYVLSGLAVDWWSLLRNEWIELGNFGL